MEERYSALSIDVEDGVNILMRDLFGEDMSPTDRVIGNVDVLLDLFGKYDVRATFFILGEIASAYPALVKKIASGGHELGVHGYNHDQIFKLTPEKAREDIHRAKALIEDVSGKAVHGFRAPAFSISKETSWALDILAELGFSYDSSIVPASAKRYGWPGFRQEIHRMDLSGGRSLIEVPLSVSSLLGRSIPACGGGYLRHFPYALTRSSFLKIQKERPVIVYLHPYELDTGKYPDFFYKAKASLDLKQRIPLSFYRLNKGTVKGKLEKLIREFHFKPIIDIIEDYERDHR
ncbi:MAG: polysaccharide deacetylase family protein [Bacteroidales bacterium]|nr:polysaccharide deacetylase family protein [Bacteroidales bacterium]